MVPLGDQKQNGGGTDINKMEVAQCEISTQPRQPLIRGEELPLGKCKKNSELFLCVNHLKQF